MIHTVVKNVWIPCFIFELSTVLYNWLMTSFCLQNVKKIYKIYYISRGKSTQRSFFQLKWLLNIVSIHETIFITSFSSGEMFPSTVTFQRSDTPIFPYNFLVICKQSDVVSWYLELVDKMKSKWDMKEI